MSYKFYPENTFQGIQWSQWDAWSLCGDWGLSACGEGQRTRSRTCEAGCQNVNDNDLDDIETCNQQDCKSQNEKWSIIIEFIF